MVKLIAAALLFSGCGRFVIETKGSTSHEVTGGTTNTIVITVDFTPCKQFSKVEDQEDCMRTLLRAMDMAQTGGTDDIGK